MTDPRRIFFLIYDDMEILDLTGPYDVFSMSNIIMENNPDHAVGMRKFEMFMVSPARKTVEAMHGLKVVPDYGFDDCPLDEIDVLIVPGGTVKLMFGFEKVYPTALDWLADAAGKADTFASICIGGLIAAKAGLFAGLKATTHHDFHAQLATFSQNKATVLPGARYVDNGEDARVLSSAGVSAGIDLAFHMLEQFTSPVIRRKTESLMEYNGTTNWVY
ncbi:MAG: DJ-1/PfpI family protein [Pseudomonadota bacterium]